MNAGTDPRFGRAWISFALVLTCHVADEATHNFLFVYNPTAMAIRARFWFLPIPTFTFTEWIAVLGVAIALLILLTPLAWRGVGWIRLAALPIGLVVGIGNAALHILSSLYLHRLMPGVLTAPLLLVAGAWLIARSRKPGRSRAFSVAL
jgi:hypothetical protein